MIVEINYKKGEQDKTINSTWVHALRIKKWEGQH
jgi:hypothetical protein